MGFYAACTKAVWLFRLAQRQQQTAAVGDNQAAMGLTERETRPISTEGKSLCYCLSINEQHYCTTVPDRQADIFFLPRPVSGRLHWHAHEQITWQGKSAYAHSLSNLISSNMQRWHRSNICQHGPSLVRWDSKQELNPLWCCWGKRVTRAILSRTSAFSPLRCNSIPVLNQDLRLRRPTCSLSN